MSIFVIMHMRILPVIINNKRIYMYTLNINDIAIKKLITQQMGFKYRCLVSKSVSSCLAFFIRACADIIRI